VNSVKAYNLRTMKGEVQYGCPVCKQVHSFQPNWKRASQITTLYQMGEPRFRYQEYVACPSNNDIVYPVIFKSIGTYGGKIYWEHRT